MRQAVKLIRGVQLGVEQEHFRFSVFSAIPWFKVRQPGLLHVTLQSTAVSVANTASPTWLQGQQPGAAPA